MGRCSRLGDRARLQAEACRLSHDRRGAEPPPRTSDDVRRAQRRSAFGGVEWFAHCTHRKTGREWTRDGGIGSAGARQFRCKEYGRFGNPVGGVDRIPPPYIWRRNRSTAVKRMFERTFWVRFGNLRDIDGSVRIPRLLDQIMDAILLMLVHPTGQGDDQK